MRASMICLVKVSQILPNGGLWITPRLGTNIAGSVVGRWNVTLAGLEDPDIRHIFAIHLDIRVPSIVFHGDVSGSVRLADHLRVGCGV